MGNNTLLLVIVFIVFFAFCVRALVWYLNCREIGKLDSRFLKIFIPRFSMPIFSKYELKVDYGQGEQSIQNIGFSMAVNPVPKGSSVQVFLKGEAYSEKFQVDKDPTYNLLILRKKNHRLLQLIFAIILFISLILYFVMPEQNRFNWTFIWILIVLLPRIILYFVPPKLEFKTVNYCKSIWKNMWTEV